MLILISEEKSCIVLRNNCLICDHYCEAFQAIFSQFIVNGKYDFDFDCNIYGLHRKFVLMCKLCASNNSCIKDNKENSKDICKARFQNSLNFQIKMDYFSKKLLFLIQFLIIMVNFLEHKWDHLLFILV